MKKIFLRREKLEKIRNAADDALIQKIYASPTEIRRLIEESSINPDFNISFGISSTAYYCSIFDPKVNFVLQTMIEEQIQK